MSLSPICYLLKPERLEPASSATSWLGRIVRHYAVPDADFTPASPSRLLGSFTISETKVADVNAFMENKGNGQLNLQLTGLASTFRTKGKDSGVEFSTTSIRHVRLQNHEKVFHAIASDGEVKEDIGRMLRPGGDPAYFIVGMLIWENATFTDSRSSSKGIGASIQLPVSAVLAASTGADILGKDVEATADSQTSNIRSLSGISEGSSIFAFEYRTVRRRIYSVGSNFTPRLGGYGGRIEKDKVFGHSNAQQLEASGPGEALAEMDEDEEGISWTDLVEQDLEVEDVQNLSLAFDWA